MAWRAGLDIPFFQQERGEEQRDDHPGAQYQGRLPGFKRVRDVLDGQPPIEAILGTAPPAHGRLGDGQGRSIEKTDG